MEKTAHWGIHFTGEDADKVNVQALIEGLNLNVKVTSSHLSLHYEEAKPETEAPKK